MDRSSAIAWSVAVVVVLVVVVSTAARIKRAMLPDYAEPGRIQALFSDQLDVLRGVAAGGQQADTATSLFENPAIHAATAWTSVGPDGKGGSTVKAGTPEWERVQRRFHWLPLSAEVGRPAVDIWRGRMAVYDELFKTSGGEVVGLQFVVDVEYLKQNR